MWIIFINGEENITYQVTLNELNHRQTPRGKSKVNISLRRRNSYQKTDLVEIHYIFDQLRTVVLYLEVFLPDKPITPNNICEYLNGPNIQFWKESLFVKYDKNKNVSLILSDIPIKPLPEGTKVPHSLIAPSIK